MSLKIHWNWMLKTYSKYKHTKMKNAPYNHLATKMAECNIIQSFIDQLVELFGLDDLGIWFTPLRTCEKAGWFGGSNGTFSLLSIETTSFIVGLSSAFSCTQRSAILTYLINISLEGTSSKTGSINSNTLSLVHKSHTLTSTHTKLVNKLDIFHWKTYASLIKPWIGCRNFVFQTPLLCRGRPYFW